MTARPSAVRRGAAVLAAAAWGLVALLPGAPPVARGAEYTMSTEATYSVQPRDRRVAVSVRVTFENTTPDPAGEFSVFEVIDLAVQPGSSDLAARDGDGALTVIPTPRDGYIQASVRPRAAVRYEQRTIFTLTYQIPDGAASGTRIRPSLVSFPVWSFGTEGRVTVNVPGSFDVSVDGDELTAERAASSWVLESGEVADPTAWLAQVVAVGEASHDTATRAVPLASGTVELQVRAWSDDEAWGERTLELVAATLPLLEGTLGLTFPGTGVLVVEETLSGSQDPLDEPAAEGTRVLAGYDQPDFTLLHQLGHVWLTPELVAEPWITEGFASWAAAVAAAELEVEPAYDPVARRDELADDGFPLVSWGAGEASAAQDAFAYAAAWAVADELAARVGEDRLRMAWRRIAAGIGPYQPVSEDVPAGQPAPNVQPVDSRALLDHLESVSDAELGELFEAWVFDAGTVAQLGDRAAARAAYAGLLDVAGDWGAPDPVTVDLAAWRFDSAQERIAEAIDWLADRDRLIAAAERAGLSLPQRLRDRYRTAGGSGDARDELDAEAAVVSAYQEALDLAGGERGIVERIGLLGATEPDQLLRDANALFAEGDLRGAADATAQARAGLEHAATQGLVRVAAAVAVAVALLVLAWALARRHRSRSGGARPPSDYTAAP